MHTRDFVMEANNMNPDQTALYIYWTKYKDNIRIRFYRGDSNIECIVFNSLLYKHL